jgi:hypothetical protein
MQIFLKTGNGRTVTLDVEGSDTYEDVVTKINNYLDNIDPLITKPRIIIEEKELLPGGPNIVQCQDIGVHEESEGHITERDVDEYPRELGDGEWVNKLSPDRKTSYIKSLYLDYLRKAEHEAHKRGGGRKKRKSRRTRRKGSKRKGSKRKGSKRKGSRRGRKSRRTRRR